MILRLAAGAALHGAAGVAFGIGTAFAAYAVAEGARKRMAGGGLASGPMPEMPPSPYTPPSASRDSENTGPFSSGAPDGRI